MSHCICNNTRVRLPVANESPTTAEPRHPWNRSPVHRWSPAIAAGRWSLSIHLRPLAR